MVHWARLRYVGFGWKAWLKCATAAVTSTGRENPEQGWLARQTSRCEKETQAAAEAETSEQAHSPFPLALGLNLLPPHFAMEKYKGPGTRAAPPSASSKLPGWLGLTYSFVYTLFLSL